MRLVQEGPYDAKIMIVGEAPGKTEEQKGTPFAGESGRILNSVLTHKQIAIPRQSVFITNVVHVRPPKNDFSYFFRGGISPDYMRGVVQLKQDIDRIKPNIVVPLGANALFAITQKKGIEKWRGSILESTLVPGQKVIASWHPAHCLHTQNYAYKAVIELDFIRINEESEFPDIRLPQREHILDPEMAQRDAVAVEMCNAEWLAIDIECFEDKSRPAGWSLSCVGFSDRWDRSMVLPATPANMPTIKMLCASAAKKVFQNGVGFDLFVLEDEGIPVNNYSWDTMLGMHSLYPECASSSEETQLMTGKKKQQPALRKGLAFQTSIWTKEPYYKDDGKLWKETEDLQTFWLYNGRDAAVTREIMDGQKADLEGFGVYHVFEHEMRLASIFREMTRRGIKIDLAEHERLRKKYLEEIDRLQSFLDDGAGQSVNVKSKNDVPWLLYDKLGLPVVKHTKAGAASADKDAINKLAEKFPDNPLLMSILEIRERRDLIERYLNATYDNDGRMRTMFDVTGTRTGRPASRISIYGTGANMQNQPQELRSMYVADDGMALVSADYSQAEARVVAWLARCEALIELFSDPNRDVHSENAARFARIDVSQVTPKQRYTAKRVVHASNYGMAVAKLVRVVNNDYRDTGIRISFEEGRLGQESYFMMYPEIKTVFWKEVRDELWASRILTSPTIQRKRMFLGKWDDNFLNEAYSYKPQGAVGDLTCLAMIEIHKHVPEAQLLLNGFDSIVVQTPVESVPSVAAAMQRHMAIPITIFGRELIIPTDVEVGYNWGKRKIDKKTGEVTNPRGLRSLEEWIIDHSTT